MIPDVGVRRRFSRRLAALDAVFLLVAALARAEAQPVQKFPLPADYAWTFNVAADSDGAIWFGASYPNRGIGRVSPTGGIVVYPIPTSFENIGGVVVGPDGNVWFSLWSNTPPLGSNGAIGRISRSGTGFQQFLLHAPVGAFFNPRILVAGPDGNIWFTAGDTRLGRITMSGDVDLFILQPSSCYGIGQSPYGLAVGPDGAIWMAVQVGRGLVRFDMTTGVFEEVPLGPCGVSALNVAVGPDGNLWVTDSYQHLYRMTMARQVTTILMPGYPYGIVASSDSLFITRFDGNKVSRIEPETGAVLTDYDGGLEPLHLAVDPAGNIWFNEQSGHRIGRIRRPPRCVDSIGLAYGAGTLSVNFAVKTPAPGSWVTWLFANNTFTPLWAVRIPVVSPAALFTVPIPLADVGVAGVLTFLVSDEGDVCGDWKTIATTSSVPAIRR